MKTKFWLLQRDGGVCYDEVDGFVVEASTEARARKVAAGSARDEGAATWLDKKLSACTELKPSSKELVVLRSFNAG